MTETDDKKPEPAPAVVSSPDTVDEEDEVMDPEKEARMLLNPPADSVQFSGGSNGAQVTLPSGAIKTGVGMTKAELMKYANDPFWVRLRMFLFVLFWVVWLAMLFGAVAIIAFAPGCPATAKLPWWKKCSLMQVSVKDEGANYNDKIVQATQSVANINKNLPTLAKASFDGILLSGVNPFFLASPDVNSDNSSLAEALKFKETFIELVKGVHGEEFNKGKLLVNLRLAETSTSNDWYVRSWKNETGFDKLYIWRGEIPRNTPEGVSWEFSPERLNYFVRRNAGNAMLNFNDEQAKTKMRALVIDWVRTRLDGIQSDGDFFVDANDEVKASQEVAGLVREWVKTGGDNKAFLIENSKFSNKLDKDAEDSNVYELSPDPSLWNDLSKASDLKKKLEEVFQNFISKESEMGIANKTYKDFSLMTADQTGDQWKTYRFQHPESEKNPISMKNGKQIGEGITAAFFMMPKVTPIVEVQSEQLTKLDSNTFLPKLQALRKKHSEEFLLGESKILKVSDPEVFALQRMFYEKNSIILLINFSGVSKSITLSGDSLPDASTHEAKVLLVDSQSKSETTVGYPTFTIGSKQVIMLEIAPKK